MASPSNVAAAPTPFPIPSKSATGLVDAIPTFVRSLFFSDKIVITISQEGRLAQWVDCSLTSNPTASDTFLVSSNDDALLPSSRFTPRSLLGAANSDREILGHLYASQIAHALVTKNPDEQRSLVLGLGLGKDAGQKAERTSFLQAIDLVLECI